MTAEENVRAFYMLNAIKIETASIVTARIVNHFKLTNLSLERIKLLQLEYNYKDYTVQYLIYENLGVKGRKCH